MTVEAVLIGALIGGFVGTAIFTIAVGFAALTHWLAERATEALTDLGNKYWHPREACAGDDLGAIICRGQNRYRARPAEAKPRWLSALGF